MTAKRAIVFVDGQNLYHAAKEAFAYTYPNYNIRKLANRLCSDQGWSLKRVHFYTGVPSLSDNPFWHGFWTRKLAAMGKTGVKIFTRPLRYRNKTVDLPGGATHTFRHGEEKGIDVRIALDVVSATRRRELDVALILSQDQDLSEVADEIRAIAKDQKRWIKIASAYPIGAKVKNRRGINKTDWIQIDQATYDKYTDVRDWPSPEKVDSP